MSVAAESDNSICCALAAAAATSSADSGLALEALAAPMEEPEPEETALC